MFKVPCEPDLREVGSYYFYLGKISTYDEENRIMAKTPLFLQVTQG